MPRCHLGFLWFYARRLPARTIALGLCILGSVSILPATAATITWTNISGGAWSVAANWSSHTLPGSFDDVFITSAGSYTIIMDVSPTISSLTLGGASGQQTLTNLNQTLTLSHASIVNATGILGLNGGHVNGAATLTINGLLQWNGGSTGPGFSLTVMSNAVMNIQSGVNFAGTVTNFGTVNWLGGSLQINTNSGSTGVFWNQAGAVFDIQCSQNVFYGLSLPTFHNAGLLCKEVVAGTTTFGVFLINSGTVQAKVGSIQFPNGSDLGGTFQADSGAAISFTGGTFTLSSPPNFQGPGSVQLTGGSLALNAFTGTFTLNGIALVGQNTVAATGTINLNGSNLNPGAALTVSTNAVLNIQSGVNFQGAVTNFGTVNWLGGSLQINTNSGSTGVFWNQAGAVFDIQCSQSLLFGLSLPTFHNAGLLRKEAVAGTTTFGVFLINSGTVQAKVGSIQFPNGSDLGGTFQADSGAAISFTGGTYTLSSPPNFQGPGSVQLTGGSLTLNAFIGTFTLNGIALIGQNTVAATGTINLNGSNLNPGAALTVSTNAVLNIQSGVNFQGAVTNFGTVNWLGGSLQINTNSGSTGVFWNQAGAVFDIQCSQSLLFGLSLPTFHNAGLLRKEVVAGTTTFGVFLNNTGTVQARVGSIQFPNGSDLGGTFQSDSGAAISFTGGTYTLSSPPNFQGPGSVQLTGGSLTLNAFTGTFTLNGIALIGQNTVAATGTINLNGSNLNPGAALTVSTNAVLNIQSGINFAGAVTNFGTVNWLGGSLQINTNSGSTGVFWNQAGAVFDIQCSQSLVFGLSLPTFHNAGLIRKSANNGTTAITVALDNTGTIQAQVGVIGIQGPYIESPSATLAISLSGLSAGTGFGKILFTAAPTFAGKFSLSTLNGYRPNSGDSFLVIGYPSFAGGFTSYTGLDLGGGLQLTPNLSATGLTLVAVGSALRIANISLSGTNLVINGVNGLSGRTYFTLMSTNVAKPLTQWSPIATNVLSANGNFTITVTNTVNPTVRQRFYVLQLQ